VVYCLRLKWIIENFKTFHCVQGDRVDGRSDTEIASWGVYNERPRKDGMGCSGTEIASWGVYNERPRNDGMVEVTRRLLRGEFIMRDLATTG